MPRCKYSFSISARLCASSNLRAPFDNTEMGEDWLPLTLMQPTERAVLNQWSMLALRSALQLKQRNRDHWQIITRRQDTQRT